MNTLTLVLLTWACVATALCLFIHGANVKDSGRKVKRDTQLAKDWQDRMFSGN